MSRLTKRKRLVLDILASNNPVGLATLNELRVKSRWMGDQANGMPTKSDRRKSFNRTVINNFPELHKLHLSSGFSYTTEILTAGIFARWAVWSLIDRGSITGIPEDDEIILVVGRDACTAFTLLRNNQYSIIGHSVFLEEIILVSSRKAFNSSDLTKLGSIPWSMHTFLEGELCTPPTNLLVSELDRLPYSIPLQGHRELSTARTKPPRF